VWFKITTFQIREMKQIARRDLSVIPIITEEKRIDKVFSKD
jgi:hypothetical protein